MDGDGVSTISDSSSRNHTIEKVGTATTTTRFKKFGTRALDIPVDGFLKITDNVSDFRIGATTPFSMEFHMTQKTEANQYFLSCYDPTSDGYAFYYQSSNNTIYLVVNGVTVLSFVQALTVGQSYHIQLCGTGSQIKCRIDGVTKATADQVAL
jgi:hypothetical protein